LDLRYTLAPAKAPAAPVPNQEKRTPTKKGEHSHTILNVSPLLVDKLQLDKKHYLCDMVELDEDDG
jgi:hypothetical protein